MPARVPGQAELMPRCPLPGCTVPVEDPRTPCPGCQAELGPWLRPAPGTVTAAEFTAISAAGDTRVLEVMAERAGWAPPPEPAADGARRSQLCWSCGERRTCIPDPAWPGRLACRDCAGTPLAIPGEDPQ